MTGSMMAFFGWIVIASGIALLPRRMHGPGAVALVMVGIPLAGWVTYQNGPFWGMAAIAAGASILRWPLIHLVRWVRRHLPGNAE